MSKWMHVSTNVSVCIRYIHMKRTHYFFQHSSKTYSSSASNIHWTIVFHSVFSIPTINNRQWSNPAILQFRRHEIFFCPNLYVGHKNRLIAININVREFLKYSSCIDDTDAEAIPFRAKYCGKKIISISSVKICNTVSIHGEKTMQSSAV